jgi:manganese/zinc/iron transport system substrate-binding protein
MRLFVYKILLVIAFFTASSCTSSADSRSSSWYDDNKKIKVLSTIAMIDDLVGRVGGDRIDHTSLIAGEIDPHSYELVKGDDEKMASADLFLYNGLHLEHGASLCYRIQKHPNAIGVGDYILSQHPERILHSAQTIDPHVWMDISTWIYVVDPIVNALIALDPEGASYYEKNAAELRQQMNATHMKIVHLLQAVPEHQRYLVTSHDAFGYFAKRYLATEEERVNGTWRKRFAAPEGLAPDGQLGARDIQGIIDHLVMYNIQTVFAESNISKDSLKKIVSASKEKKHHVNFSDSVLYGDAMGSYEHPVSSYLEMIEQNALSLLKEWNNS